ncbi:protein jagunal-like isoform X2 [Lineus longissimus]|uniref:protein jagunal-like isoform X2 n=1 Tax=Lineus longissimus TaxID=88925 RepID=UPI002B4DC154
MLDFFDFPEWWKIRAANKSRMRTVAMLHFSLFVLMLLRLSASLLPAINIKPPKTLEIFHFPNPELWEYAWLVSILAMGFAWSSLGKNRVFLLKQYIIGTIVFGFAPIIYGVYEKAFDLLDYAQTRKPKSAVGGVPLVVLWFMFFTIAVQVHGFGVYFSMQLLKAWQPQRTDKKTK